MELDNLCKLYKKLTTNANQQQTGQSTSIGKRSQARSTSEVIIASRKIRKTCAYSQTSFINIDYFRSINNFHIQNISYSQGIDRATFRELLHNTFNVITEDILVERLFCCWDREIEGTIRLEPWIIGLDVFLRGSLQDRIVFCFHVYDLNNDGYITKDEIFQLLK